MNANSSADAKFRKSAKTGPNQPQKAPEVPGKFRGSSGEVPGRANFACYLRDFSSGEFRGVPGRSGEPWGAPGGLRERRPDWTDLAPRSQTRRNAQNGSKLQNTQISRKSKVFGVNQDLGRMFLTTGGLLRNLNTNCVQLLYGHCLNNNMIWTLS